MARFLKPVVGEDYRKKFFKDIQKTMEDFGVNNQYWKIRDGLLRKLNRSPQTGGMTLSTLE